MILQDSNPPSSTEFCPFTNFLKYPRSVALTTYLKKIPFPQFVRNLKSAQPLNSPFQIKFIRRSDRQVKNANPSADLVW